MRKDMSKVIVERPRHNHSARHSRSGRPSVLEGEDGEPLRARARLGRQRKTKGLNENLAPLRRYLESQVGRPWNKIYSEIAQHLKPTSTVQQHVRDHLCDLVAISARMVEGQVMVQRRYPGDFVPLEEDWRTLFVHPRTGLLKRNSKARSYSRRRRELAEAKAAERAKRMRELAPDLQLHLLNDGAWWEVRLASGESACWEIVRNGRRTLLESDVVLSAGLSDLSASELYGRTGVHAVAKRQLNKTEKKRLGLPLGAQ
jgi:hypothetical protein